MRINHNIAALNTYRQLTANGVNTQKNLEKLSSGLRINRAGDDAAGLAISEKMRGQIRGLEQASRNSQDAISLIQTAEGALNETHSILQRMRELAVQSANDTNTADDRKKIQAEVDQLAKEITRISNDTEFNTQNLLAGGLNNTYQIGSNQGQNINLTINAMDAKSLGVARDINQVTAFSAGTTTLTSSAIGEVGSGLTAGTYSIEVTHNAATTTVTGNTTAGAVTTGGSYTGARNQTAVQFKVTGVTDIGGGVMQVTAAQYSTDGGTTWNAASVAAGVITYQGATLTVADDAGNAVGDTITVDFTARNDSIQLKQGATNIGSAVTVYSDQDTVTIGDASTSQTVQINSTSLGDLTTGTGINAATINITTQASTAATIGTDGTVITKAVAQAGIDVSTQAAANSAITTIDNAIKKVSEERSKLGAVQNRLEHTINNLGTSAENLTAAESRIRDVDYALAA
jgi:flagellin